MKHKSGNTSAQAQTSRVRIVAGRWRGRWLGFDAKPGLRPTGDRMRETLFNWLQNYPPAQRCLDLFAGTGALGIEAASRGAKSVTLVERDADVARRLRREITKLEADNIVVEHADAQTYLTNQGMQSQFASGSQFDLIFLDPPFAEQSPLACLQQIMDNNLVSADGLIYVESSRSDNSIVSLPDSLEELRDKTMGKVRCTLLRYRH